MSTLSIVHGNVLQKLSTVFTDSSGNAVNLTGHAVKITIWARGSTAALIDTAATIATPASGTAYYKLTAADWTTIPAPTNTAEYLYRWEIVYSGSTGKIDSTPVAPNILEIYPAVT